MLRYKTINRYNLVLLQQISFKDIYLILNWLVNGK
jgi:hypothetical protein